MNKREYEDAMRQSEYINKNTGVPLEQLENDKLGRLLTEQEISAVKWFSKYHNGVGPKHRYYDNAIRSLIVGANIPGILDMYTKHSGDIFWENMALMNAEYRYRRLRIER